MSRRHAAEIRKVEPEPRYNSESLSKFINTLMLNGKKSVAEKIVYQAIETAAERSKSQHKPDELFAEVIGILSPRMEVKSRRVGGATYPVPREVRPVRSVALAMRWLIEAARKRNEKDMARRLCAELMDALEQRGNAFRKREDMHKAAEANKAFSHYRF